MIDPPKKSEHGHAFPLYRFKHNAMACTFELALVSEDADYAEQAARAAFAEIDRLECELSRFIPTSDIARINAIKPGETVRVGIEAVECLQLAARVCAETNGAFDVTYSSRTHQRDAGATHVAAAPRGGRSMERSTATSAPLELDPKGRYVRVRAEGVRVDLGAVGKGYAIDQVLTILRDWSITAGLIHSGQSSVLAFGSPPGAEAWTIALRDPVNDNETLERVTLKDAALSGSGHKLHGDHIIDPRGGRPADDKLGTWALAPSAALSDALATAFMVMSRDEVAEYCRRHPDVSALLYTNTPRGPALTRLGKARVVSKL